MCFERNVESVLRKGAGQMLLTIYRASRIFKSPILYVLSKKKEKLIAFTIRGS